MAALGVVLAVASCGRASGVSSRDSAGACVADRDRRACWRSARASSCSARASRPTEWLRGRRGAAAACRRAAGLDASCRRAPGTAPSAGASSTTRSIRPAIASASVDEPVDPERPTILFTGESVMFGEGLTWDESVPGAGRQRCWTSEREPRRPRLRHRPGVSAARGRAAPLSAPRGRRLAVHDGALRPQPRSTTGRTWGPGFDGCRRNHGRAWTRSPYDRALPQQRRRGTWRHGDPRGAPRHRRLARARPRRRWSSCRSSARKMSRNDR